MFKIQKEEIDFGGKKLVLETGKVARQADGAIIAKLGEKPTHPELLDYLAAHFIQQEFSIKEMVQFLVTTEAYRRSTESSAASIEKDPTNSLLQHMPLRRIGAEAFRGRTGGRQNNVRISTESQYKSECRVLLCFLCLLQRIFNVAVFFIACFFNRL